MYDMDMSHKWWEGRGRIFKVDGGDNDKDYKRIRFPLDGVSIPLNIAFIVAYCFYQNHLHDKVPGYLNRCFANTCTLEFISPFSPHDFCYPSANGL